MTFDETDPNNIYFVAQPGEKCITSAKINDPALFVRAMIGAAYFAEKDCGYTNESAVCDIIRWAIDFGFNQKKPE